MNRNIIATILIVLAIGMYFTVTESIMASAGAVKTVNNQYQSAIASADKLISVRDKITQDYNNLSQNDRDRLAKIVPNSVDNIRLIIDLNNIALKHGFSLGDIKAAAAPTNDKTNNIQPQPQAAVSGGSVSASASTGMTISTPTLDTVDVSFSAIAPYQSFKSFMQDLESSLRLMDVTHLTVAANDSGTYTFTVALQTYWLRQQ